MPTEGAPEIGRENEKAAEGADDQREQMGQPGKGEETPGVYKGVDKLFPVCRHEKPDGTDGRVVTPPNPRSVLETMEESAHKIQDVEGVTPARMESARNGKLPERSVESSSYAEFCAYKNNHSGIDLDTHPCLPTI